MYDVFKHTHRLNDKLIQNEILWENNLLLIIVDISALTGAFVGMVCLIAVQFRGKQDVVDVGGLVRPIVSVHRLVLLCPETERRTAIRQTVPTKAPVEAETATIINKRLFFQRISFWIKHVWFVPVLYAVRSPCRVYLRVMCVCLVCMSVCDSGVCNRSV